MKKFSTKSTNRVIVLFILKDVIVTISAICLLSFISGEIIYKLDLSLENVKLMSLFICAISAFAVSILSTTGLKNSVLVFGILSEIPLIFYTLINVIFNDSDITYFFIKLPLIILIGAFGGILSSRRSKSFKVK